MLTGGRAETAARGRDEMAIEPLVGPRKMGVLMFLCSESMLFATVIAQYVRGQAQPIGPTPHDVLDVPKTFAFSVALWLSSLTVQLALLAVKRGSSRMMRVWLLLTAGLGGIFLWGEVSEWFNLFHQNVTASRSIFATSFFSLTGIHGIHVMVGLGFLLGTVIFSFFHQVPRSNDSGLEIVAIYWHFVDGMWVLLFGTIYFWSATLGG